MATYLEIFDLRSNSALKNRIGVACVVAAEAIRTEAAGTTNHANRMIWAKGPACQSGKRSRAHAYGAPGAE